MYSLLSPYLGQLTCGIDIDLSPYNVEDTVASTLVTSSEPPDIDNMEVTPLDISIEDLCETNKKVYVEFKWTENESWWVLMSHKTHVPSLKLDPKTGNMWQYNAVVGYIESQKSGVLATMLSDYEEFIANLMRSRIVATGMFAMLSKHWLKKAFLIGFPKVGSVTSSYHQRVHTKLFIFFGSSPKTKTVLPNKRS